MTADADGHEGLMEGGFEILGVQVVIVQREAILHDHVACEGHETCAQRKRFAAIPIGADAFHEQIDFVANDGFQGDNPCSGEEGIESSAALEVEISSWCSEDRLVTVEAVGHPLVFVDAASLCVESVVELRVLDVNLVWHYADNGS